MESAIITCDQNIYQIVIKLIVNQYKIIYGDRKVWACQQLSRVPTP